MLGVVASVLAVVSGGSRPSDKAGGGHPRYKGGGGVSKKTFFGPSGLSLSSKQGGGPGSPPLDPPLVVCKRMQQLPVMLGPAAHRGKDTIHKTHKM